MPTIARDLEAATRDLPLVGYLFSCDWSGVRVQRRALLARLAAAGFGPYAPPAVSHQVSLGRAIRAWIAERAAAGERAGLGHQGGLVAEDEPGSGAATRALVRVARTSGSPTGSCSPSSQRGDRPGRARHGLPHRPARAGPQADRPADRHHRGARRHRRPGPGPAGGPGDRPAAPAALGALPGPAHRRRPGRDDARHPARAARGQRAAGQRLGLRAAGPRGGAERGCAT